MHLGPLANELENAHLGSRLHTEGQTVALIVSIVLLSQIVSITAITLWGSASWKVRDGLVTRSG